MMDVITNQLYLNYNTVLRKELGKRVQKISINAGFTCPNRDGSKGFGGCTYCNNQSFSPNFTRTHISITDQIHKNIAFFKKRYPHPQKYLAYFQSYTNTYNSLDNLIRLYEEALQHPSISGIVIGTRPDCVSEELLSYFEAVAQNRYVMIEYGVESTNNKTLELIHRGHDYECAVTAIKATAARNIHTGAHLILGLPGEDIDTILKHADEISQLPVTALKLHQLQLIKGTIMAKQYKNKPEEFHLFILDGYLQLVIRFLERLRPDIALERFISQSPLELLVAPTWGIKNYVFTAKLNVLLQEQNTWQGKFYNK